MNTSNPIRIKLNEYNSKINIMAILCSKSASYCNKIKNMITVTVILLSGSVAITTSIYDDIEKIKIPIIILNALITLIIGFERSFKYAEIASNFHKYSQSYNKLSHDIDKQNTNGNISPEFLTLIISLYDNISDSINEGFPGCVLKEMKDQYDTTDSRLLPTVFEKYTPSNSFFNTSFKGSLPLPPSPTHRRESPILHLPNINSPQRERFQTSSIGFTRRFSNS